MAEKLTSYELSRNWFDWCFENPERISPNHTAMYFFIIEHCNRLGWKAKFGLPSTMVKDAIGIKSYNTYIKTLNDLVEWDFVKIIEKSKNQYSSNIVALSKNVKATNKALDKALIKHVTKQSESTVQSNSSIDKPINNKPINNKPFIPSIDEFLFYASTIPGFESKHESLKYSLTVKFEAWRDDGWKDGNGKSITNWKNKLKNTIIHLKAMNDGTTKTTGRTTAQDRMDELLRRSSITPDRQHNGQEFTSFEGVD